MRLERRTDFGTWRAITYPTSIQEGRALLAQYHEHTQQHAGSYRLTYDDGAVAARFITVGNDVLEIEGPVLR